MPATAADPASSTLRAFALLELVGMAERPPSLDDLTRASGLPKPTVYRLLRLLIRGGLVQRDVAEKRYLVGRRTCALSLQVQMRSPFGAQRHAVLTRLVDEIGETCNFTMLDGAEVVYLDRVETPEKVRLHMDTGSRVPLHCTASGKLFLSHLAPSDVRRLIGSAPLKRYTARTIVDPNHLLRELHKIRVNAIGIDAGEYLDGSVCLAVPVMVGGERVCAAIAVHGPAPRMTLKRGYQFLPALRRAAAAVASTLSTPEKP